MRATGVRALVVAMVGVTMLAGTACGGDEALPANGGEPSPTETGGEPTDGGTTLVLGSGGAFRFSPAALTVEQGAALTLRNADAAGHTFTIADQDIDVELDGGTEQQITIELAPGTYPFACRFHEASGMVGTLTVSG